MKTFILYHVIPALFLLAFINSVAVAQEYGGCYINTPSGPFLVQSIMTPGLNDIATATIVNGRPVILYNPNVVANTRPQTRLFFYVHECGHHVRGHLLTNIALNKEQDADCYSIVTLVKGRYFKNADVDVVQEDLAQFGKADWTHLPGPQRAINLRQCLSAAGVSADDDEEESDKENKKSEKDSSPQETVTFTIKIDAIRIGGFKAEVAIEIDGEEVGEIANIDGDRSVDVDSFAAGSHRYTLKVKYYSYAGYRPVYNSSSTSSGSILVRDGDVFVVGGSNSNPRLIKR